MRGGIDPRDHRLRPRVVGVSDVWKYLCSRDGILSSLDAAGSRRCPEGQLSPRAGSIGPADQQSADGGGVSTHLRVGMNLGDTFFIPRV